MGMKTYRDNVQLHVYEPSNFERDSMQNGREIAKRWIFNFVSL